TRGGKNIYPEEIEEKIGESQFVEEVLVLMEKNVNTGLDELVAYIYPNFETVDEYCQKKGEIPCEGNIYDILMGEIKRVNGKMADYKKIRRIVIREEEFPKTSTKKIKRYLFIQKGREVE
ncbi:long-chain fatty acid--CoA ligase, partial [Candidatus Calescamantes bacterium]|nr:long-chain fatty acid--CoA ligase [Candidatus Calescamantes bacterium]